MSDIAHPKRYLIREFRDGPAVIDTKALPGREIIGHCSFREDAERVVAVLNTEGAVSALAWMTEVDDDGLPVHGQASMYGMAADTLKALGIDPKRGQ